jgi:hypothetical protein
MFTKKSSAVVFILHMEYTLEKDRIDQESKQQNSTLKTY